MVYTLFTAHDKNMDRSQSKAVHQSGRSQPPKRDPVVGEEMILDHRMSLRKSSSVAAIGGNTQQDQESERPPPYTSHTQSSSHPGESSRRRVPPVPAFPPASASSSRFAHSESPAGGKLEVSRHLPPPHTPPKSAFPSKLPATPTAVEPQAVVRQINLSSKKEPIIGTFHIDPRVPTLATAKKNKKGKQPALPHATFRTSSGDVQLSLGTNGNINETPKSNVSVYSGSGNIEIEVLPIFQSRPRIGLDVTSHQGDIAVHLPESFSGLIQLNTKKGDLHILPELGKMIKVLKATDKEVIVLAGTMNTAMMLGDQYSFTDLCQITTRSGKIVVGITGRDKLQEKGGFWSKVGDFFRG